MIVWDDGEFKPLEEVRVSPLDRGFTLGDGVFETIRVEAARPRRLAAHLEMLGEAARALRIAPPASLERDLSSEIAALAERNGLGDARAAVRLTLTRGEGGRGLAPPDDPKSRALMTIAPAPAPTGPTRLRVSEAWLRAPAPSTRFKTLSYADNIAALLDARAADPGIDDVVRLSAGDPPAVSGCGAANMFWIDGDVLRGPDDDCAIRQGVTRAAVLNAARSLGVRTELGRYALEALLDADAVFVTNALVGVRPVAEISGAEFEARRYAGARPLLDALTRAEVEAA